MANGDTTSSDPNLDMLGWYSKNSDNKLHRVGQKLPNGWGFYDFHGNNWEWCLDVIVNHASEAVDPRGGTNVTGNRVQRGAAYSSRVSWCRSAVRSNNVPTAGASFRCAFQMGY